MSALLASWIPFALLAGTGLLGFNICAKMGGSGLPPVMFATIMYTAGFIGMMPLFAWFMRDRSIDYLRGLPTTPVLFAIGAGMVVILIDLSIVTMFSRQAPVGLGMTTVNIVALALTTLGGFFLFKENFSPINIMGICLALISIPLMLYTTR